jgi:prepilin-type N-terminal cleavage/methylation domain-containing protein
VYEPSMLKHSNQADAGYTLIELMITMLVLVVTLIGATDLLISTQSDAARTADRSSFNDSAILSGQALSLQIRSSALASPSAGSGASSSIVLLEQTGVASQKCVEWVATGSPLALETGTWTPESGGSSPPSSLRTVAYLSGGSTKPFTVTSVSGADEVSYSMEVLSVPSSTPLPSEVSPLTLNDTIAVPPDGSTLTSAVSQCLPAA